MRYKLTGLILILLIATPLYAQSVPITVDTFPPMPTLVKTGELFTVSYRVRYLDLTRWNKEIVLFSEEIDVQRLQGQVDSFKVMSVDRREPIYKNGEYWQDFLVVFRIIDKEKGPKKLPKIQFNWAIKEAGKSGDLQTEKPVESREVYVNYFSTIAPDPYLDIRDGLKLGDYSGQAWLFRFVVPGIFLTFSFVWLFLLVRMLRKSSQAKTIARPLDLSSENEDFGPYLIDRETLSLRQARKNLVKTIRKAKDGLSGFEPQELLAIEGEIYNSILNLLMAAVPELNPGDTPKEIKACLSNVKKINPVYIDLTDRMIQLRLDLEMKKNPSLNSQLVSNLDKLANRLNWRNRLVESFRRFVRWGP